MTVRVAFLISCTEGGAPVDNPDKGKDTVISEVTVTVPVSSTISIELNTDKARYNPGETVRFTADNMPSGAKIRYRHLGDTVAEMEATGTSWEWTAPSEDFTGYLVDVYVTKEDSGEINLRHHRRRCVEVTGPGFRDTDSSGISTDPNSQKA